MSARAATAGVGRGGGAPAARASGLSAHLATAIRNSFRSPIVEAEAAELKGMRKDYLMALRSLKMALRRLLELSQSGGDEAPEESDAVLDGGGADKEGGRAALVMTELQRMAAHDSAIAGMTLSAEAMVRCRILPTPLARRRSPDPVAARVALATACAPSPPDQLDPVHFGAHPAPQGISGPR